MKKNTIKFLFLNILLVVILSLSVSAWGIVVPHMDGNTFFILPGGNEELSMSLQNLGTDNDIKLKIKLEEGHEIAEILDEDLEYLVPAGRKDVEVVMKISAPKAAPEGKEYIVKFILNQIPLTEGDGPLEVKGTIEKQFKVKIGTRPKPITTQAVQEQTAYLNKFSYLFLLIVVLAIIAFVYYKKRKK